MEKNLEQHVFPSRGNKHDVITHDMQGDDKHQHHQHHQAHNQLPFSGYYNVNIRFDPISPEAGKTTELTLSVTDQKLGDSIREFELLHDKLMHVIIVAEDLSYFAHIHPMIKDGNDNDTTFTISHTFPEPGKYKLWAEFKPKGGNQTLAAFKFNVRGKPLHRPEELVHDDKYIKPSLDGNYQISLKIPDKIVAQNDVDIAFSISDASRRPITNLEPLMAAGGHSVIISSDLREFLHVHPTEEVAGNWRGGPDISFKTNFPKPGHYKAWGQFQHQGTLITASGFVLKVV
jgi:plastocyanin